MNGDNADWRKRCRACRSAWFPVSGLNLTTNRSLVVGKDSKA